MVPALKCDLTDLAGCWTGIQIACAIALLVALDALAGTAISVTRLLLNLPKMPDADYVSWTFSFVTNLLALYVIRSAWTNSATLTETSLRQLWRTFCLVMIWLAALLTNGIYLLVSANLSPLSSTAVAVPLIQFGTLLTASSAAALLYCAWVLLCMRSLFKLNIPGLETTLIDLLRKTAPYESVTPKGAHLHLRIDQPIGFLWLVAGSTVFMIGAGVKEYGFEHWSSSAVGGDFYNPTGWARGSRLIEIVGLLMVLKARTYFVPRAEAVLAMDKRRPILYLRSFSDEASRFVQFSSAGWHIDRSFEMKMSRYFRVFGPFVAIGSPRDKLPKLGAVRLLQSDEEWQDAVRELIVNARWIVASVGLSQWIKWELGEIRQGGRLVSSIFVFPVAVARGPFFIRWIMNVFTRYKRRREQRERFIALVEQLPPEAVPVASSTNISRTDWLLASVVTSSRLVMLISKTPSMNSQFFAAIVAHCLVAESSSVAAIATEQIAPQQL